MLAINYQETMIKDWAPTDFENRKFTQIQNKYVYIPFISIKKVPVIIFVLHLHL